MTSLWRKPLLPTGPADKPGRKRPSGQYGESSRGSMSYQNQDTTPNKRKLITSYRIFSKHRPSGPMLSISRNVHIFVCLSVCLSVCVFTFEVPFNGIFAPIAWSRMSNIFRDSESLGKSNGKKWSQIWFFFWKWSKIAALVLPYKTWWKPRFPMD